MSKRSKKFSRRFLNRNRKTKASMDRHRRLVGVEPLEERQVLSGDGLQSFGNFLTSRDAADQLVIDAFERVSNLNQYTTAEMDGAERWVVKTDGSINATNFFSQTGMAAVQFDPIPNTFFAYAGTLSSQQIRDQLGANPSIEYFYPELPLEIEKHSLDWIPDDTYFHEQWHLFNTGQSLNTPNEGLTFANWGGDIRIQGAWEITTGEGATIAIVDDGLHYIHPDIAPNYNPHLSFDYTEGDPDPGPQLDNDDFHGTAVGGLAAGAGNNGQGITGVAYDADIAGLRLIGYTENPGPFEFQVYNTFIHGFDVFDENGDFAGIDVQNHSWGYFFGRAITPPDQGPIFMQGLIDSVFLGRDGYGTIHVTSTGNAGELFDRADHSRFPSSQYTIGVTGFSPLDGPVPYAEGGASTFIAAPTADNPPGTGLVTTDVFGQGQTGGDAGYNDGTDSTPDGILVLGELDDPKYTNGFNGTSGSAPIVSGVIGLMISAARDNGIELSLRDVKNILALSARQIDTEDAGWRTDLQPLFYDPPAVDGIPVGAQVTYEDGVVSGLPNISIDGVFLESDIIEQYANPTNSAGFTVHDYFFYGNFPDEADIFKPDDSLINNINYGYGFGAIDAEFAVELASNWKGVGTFAAESNTYVPVQNNTIVWEDDLGSYTLPAAEMSAGLTIPGGLGGSAGYAEYFNLWLDPPDELPEELPTNTRGGSDEFFVPPNIIIEEIEVTVEGLVIPPGDSDKLRMTIISPDGTHTELTNFSRINSTGPLTFDGLVDYTFTTVRHWGERSEGVGRVDPVTGETIPANTLLGFNDEVIAGVWQVAFENWSTSEVTMSNIEVKVFGTPAPVATDGFGNELGGRIQGRVGLDIDGDQSYNFSGVITEEVSHTTDSVLGVSVQETEVISFIDTTEPTVRGVMVYVDINGNGERDANDPQMLTGSDGNFYFDLPYNARNPVTGELLGSYEVKIEVPYNEVEGDQYTLIGDDSYTYVIGSQPDGSVQSTFIDANFTLQPAPITFSGNVYADFDLDQTQGADEANLEEFRVFVDMNENGQLEFLDLNANLVFDNGVDFALEPMAITNPDGSFTLEISTEDNTVFDIFGNAFFRNDWYVGEEYYTVMVDQQSGWTPTGQFVTEPQFSNVLVDGSASPGYAFYRGPIEPGETISGIDFGFAPSEDNGTISGFVFEDAINQGTRDPGEIGLENARVYLDLDGDGMWNGDDPDNMDPLEPSVQTTGNGSYIFDLLPAGTYDIRVNAPDGYTLADGTVPILGVYPNVQLADGASIGNGTLDFGFYNPDVTPNAPDYDYGDLPDVYGTTNSVDGARHRVEAGFFLGAGLTDETDGQPSTNADLDGLDDGVTIIDPIVAGERVRIDIEASSNSLFLQGWIDFNNDGDFADEGEHLTFGDATGGSLEFPQQVLLDSGTNELTFVVPNTVEATNLAARFRYGEGGFSQFNQPTGTANMGEVEDYIVTATVSTAFFEPLIGDFSGDNVVDDLDQRIWRQTYGSTTDLRADANGDNVVDLADYTMWRMNLGEVAQPIQTILSSNAFGHSGVGEEPLVAASVSEPIESAFPSMISTTADGSLTDSVSGPAALDSPSTGGQTTSPGTTESVIDLAFAESEDEDASGIEIAGSDDDAETLELVFALEDFGSDL